MVDIWIAECFKSNIRITMDKENQLKMKRPTYTGRMKLKKCAEIPVISPTCNFRAYFPSMCLILRVNVNEIQWHILFGKKWPNIGLLFALVLILETMIYSHLVFYDVT